MIAHSCIGRSAKVIKIKAMVLVIIILASRPSEYFSQKKKNLFSSKFLAQLTHLFDPSEVVELFDWHNHFDSEERGIAYDR